MTTNPLTITHNNASLTKETDINNKKKDLGALDWFRLAAALLVIAIHTSPLNEISENADLFLTGVAARTAIPFFFAVSGYFADLSNISGLKKLAAKAALIYAAATALYLPFGTYYATLKSILFDGTYYHLWYFPACITGAAIVYRLKKLPLPAALSIAAALYITGLFGDSYYNFAAGIEPLSKLYGGLSKAFAYTRNGIFMAPVFMLLGNVISARPPVKHRVFTVSGLIVSAALFTAERFLLRGITSTPHDNMFVFLVPLTFFLLQLLTSVKARPRPLIRSVSMWIYIIHPIIIHYVQPRTENSLQTAVIVTVITLPLAAINAIFTAKLKAVLKERADRQSPDF